jgi:hypothetical protein
MSQSDTCGRDHVTPAARATTRNYGLRPNCFSAVVMLLVQYGLGIWVNLYAQIPASDHGKGAFAAFGAAVADGPVALTLHALLGTLLLVTAIAFVVRAALARQTAAAVAGAIALLAIITAWLSGASFVGASANGASFTMATAAGVALLCYVIVLFAPGAARGASVQAPTAAGR